MTADDRTYDEACAEVYDQWFGSCEEAAVDRLAELAGGGRVLELGIGSGLLALPLAARGLDVHGIDLSPAIRLYPVEVRYAWPAELDLMARLAGLRLRHRWSNWSRGEIGPDSARHVSVYERMG